VLNDLLGWAELMATLRAAPRPGAVPGSG
jgi:hypothetical protein